jgi:hypothetical protein
MSATWFELTTASGEIRRGVVHGSGGKVSTLRHLNLAIRNATQGEPTGLYEPRPGHCDLAPYYCFAGDGIREAVSLAGAKARVAEPRWSFSWCRLCITSYGVRLLTGYDQTRDETCQLCGRRDAVALVDVRKNPTPTTGGKA